MLHQYQFFQILLLGNFTSVLILGMYVQKQKFKKELNELVYNVENEKLITNRTLKIKVSPSDLDGEHISQFYKITAKNSHQQIFFSKSDLVRTANLDFSWQNVRSNNSVLIFLNKIFETFNQSGKNF